MVAMHPRHGEGEIADMIHNIEAAARVALEGIPADQVELRSADPVDLEKFDTVSQNASHPG